MSDVLIQVRVDSALKNQAEKVLVAMGLKTSEAIRMFLQQTVNDHALPFQPSAHKVPNKKTLKAFKEAEEGKSTTVTLEEFKKLLKSK